MPLEASEWNMMAALLVLAEFSGLALLGFILVQIMQLESSFDNRKAQWLKQIRLGVTQLRQLRRKLETMDGAWPEIPLGPSMKRKWMVFRWAWRAFSAAKWARS